MGNHGTESRVKTGGDSKTISPRRHLHYTTTTVRLQKTPLGVLLTLEFHNGKVFRGDVIRNDKLIVGCRIDDASS